jgi:putative nucleotidyltransferase with HDIG domain
MGQLELIVKKARNLPVLPQVTSKLLDVINDSKAQAKDVGKIIESDQSLATQLLKQVNSPYYGFSGRISTLQHAVVIMGFNAVKNLAIGFSMAKMSRKGASNALNTEQFWEHSLGVGVGARAIGKEIGYPCPEELMAAGLVHDIGKVILADNFSEEYKNILQEAVEKDEEVYQTEKRVLKGSHDEVGEWFTNENRFPSVLKHCIKYHHVPSSYNSGEFSTAIKAINLADHLCKVKKVGWAGCSNCSRDVETMQKEIGLSNEAKEMVMESLKTEVDAAKEFFGIKTAN